MHDNVRWFAVLQERRTSFALPVLYRYRLRADTPAPMRRGEVVADRFEIERLAGSGAMGEVYRAHDRSSGHKVALKLLLGNNDEARFELEARVLAQIDHPSVVRYVAHGSTPRGGRYLAMEWLEGEDLATRLARESLSVRETLMLGAKVADALALAHARGIVHRDIKPENLFLVGREITKVKLLDFGIARVGARPRGTRTGMVLGTLGYMAPEQARGSLAIDARADVFALGCVLFECIAGVPAFSGEDMMALLVKIVLDEVPRLGELRDDVPEALDELVARMLSKDPSLRPADGAEVAAELSAIMAYESAPKSKYSQPRAELTKGEQRLLSVLLVGSANHVDLGSAATIHSQRMHEDYAPIGQAVGAHGGRLEVLADGSMVATLSGSGIATDQAAQAAECAIALRGLLPDRPMALATGRGEVTARLPVGEAVDRAAKLLRAARQGEGRPLLSSRARAILIDEVTRGLLDPRFEVENGSASIELYGVRPIVEGTRTLLGKPTACVGRDRELRTLEAIFEQCVSDRMASAVLMTAPAGVGKSRVAHEFVARLRQRGPTAEIWSARGDPSSAGSAFAMLGKALRCAAGVLEGEPLATRQERLRAKVAEHVEESERSRVSEFLGELIGAPFPDETSVQLRAARRDPMLMGDQMRRAWEDFVRAECGAHPILLVLEDLHWGDLPTVKLVDAVLRTLRGYPLMVLALGRPEVYKLFPKLWSERDLHELRLNELTPTASERLVRQVLGEEAPAALVQRLVEQADGHAFYLEELIRAVAEGKGEALPGTVLAMVQARLQGLDPEARRVLRAASVFGETFWRGGVAKLVGNAALADQWLAWLREHELLNRSPRARFPGEDEFVFRHGMVRETAYATLTEKDRKLGHRLAGEWLARVSESDPMVLAWHFERGEEPARAVRWYLRAAEQAFEGHDLDSALARAARGAISGAEGAELGGIRLLQAEVHRWRGELAEAEQRSSEAMALLAKGSAAWYGAAREKLLASSGLGHIERVLELSRTVRKSPLDESVAGAQIEALGIAHSQMLAAGRYDLAAELRTPIETLARFSAAREPAVAALLDDIRADEALSAGDLLTFFRLKEAGLASFERAGALRSACSRRLEIGAARALIGAYGDAERELREAAAAAERMGLHALSSLALHKLGFVLARKGRLEEAQAVESGAVLTFAGQHAPRLEGAARSYLAAILLQLGDLAMAERQAREAVGLLESSPPLRAQALSILAEVLLTKERPGDACEAAREAMNLLAPLGIMEEGESQVRVVFAEALAATGDYPAARRAIAEARQRLLARAGKIGDPSARDSFLSRVPENARTLDLARQWLDTRTEVLPQATTRSQQLRSIRPPSTARSQRSQTEAERCLEDAEQALLRGNPEAAIARAEQGMNHVAPAEIRARLRAALARAHGWLNVWTSARRWSEQGLREASPASAGWCTAVTAGVRATAQLGRTAELLAASEALRSTTPLEGAAPALTIATAALAVALSGAGEQSAADACYERMERLGGSIGARDAVVRGWMSRARAEQARSHEEDPWTSLRLDEEAARYFEEAGDENEARLQHILIGLDCWMLGAYERAEQLLRRTIEESGQRGFLFALAIVELAWTLCDRGKVAEAGAELIFAFKTERSRQNPVLKAASSSALAEILRRRGDLEAAAREAQSALDIQGIGPLDRTTALATLAAIRTRQGRGAEGLELAKRARAEREANGLFGFKDAFVRLVHVEALIEAGEHAQVRAPLSRAQNRILTRAAKIGDATLRKSFLRRVPENERTLELARQWLGEEAAAEVS